MRHIRGDGDKRDMPVFRPNLPFGLGSGWGLGHLCSEQLSGLFDKHPVLEQYERNDRDGPREKLVE